MTAAPRNRLPGLDGLRGIAILMVMTQHFIPLEPSAGAERVMRLFAASGWAGVDLFFVISGLLITGILLDARESGSVLFAFYARRALRILPAFSAVMLALLAFAISFPGVDPAAARALIANQGWHWSFLTNVRIALDGSWDRFPYTGHLWSLGVEEQFYLLWPALVLGLTSRRLLLAAMAMVPLAFAFRLGMIQLHLPAIGTLVTTPAKMDELALGGIIAVAARDAALRARLEKIAGAARSALMPLALFVLAATSTTALVVTAQDSSSVMWGYTLGQSFVALAAALVVASIARDADRRSSLLLRLCELSWLRRIGTYSYGLYLIHYPLDKVAHRLGVGPNAYRALLRSAAAGDLVYALVLTVLSVALASALWHGLERPVLRLRRRFPYGAHASSHQEITAARETGMAPT